MVWGHGQALRDSILLRIWVLGALPCLFMRGQTWRQCQIGLEERNLGCRQHRDLPTRVPGRNQKVRPLHDFPLSPCAIYVGSSSSSLSINRLQDDFPDWWSRRFNCRAAVVEFALSKPRLMLLDLVTGGLWNGWLSPHHISDGGRGRDIQRRSPSEGKSC